MDEQAPSPWLLLIHQIPPQPAYFRVKVGRRLQALGAVAVKNSVYVLPAGAQAREDFEWLLREIVDGGGEAVLCEARFIDGLPDARVEQLFRDARDQDYAEIAAEARALLGSGDAEAPGPQAGRFRRRLDRVIALDFFGAAGRADAEAAVAALAAAGRGGEGDGSPVGIDGLLRGRTWVTRAGVYVDRIASAWLIRRFVDPDACFRFTTERRPRAAEDELRFDTFEGEFTHEGDRCTFEVMLARLGLDDAALRAVAEVVHDVDLKDGKFARAEAAGVERLLEGITLTHTDDEARIARGAALFDDLYQAFRRGA